jgi:hypothetical protein
MQQIGGHAIGVRADQAAGTALKRVRSSDRHLWCSQCQTQLHVWENRWPAEVRLGRWVRRRAGRSPYGGRRQSRSGICAQDKMAVSKRLILPAPTGLQKPDVPR